MQTEDMIRGFLTSFFEYRNTHRGTTQSYDNIGNEHENQIIKLKCCTYSQLIQDIFRNIKSELNNSSFDDVFMGVFEHNKNDYMYSTDFDNCMSKISQMLNFPDIKLVILKHLDALDTVNLVYPYDDNQKRLASYYFRKRFIEKYFKYDSRYHSFSNDPGVRKMLFDNAQIRHLLQDKQLFTNIFVSDDIGFIGNYDPICKSVLSLDPDNFCNFVRLFSETYY